MNYLLRNIDPVLWGKVKEHCKNNQLSIRELILFLLDEEIIHSIEDK